MGLALLSNLTAFDFGYITAGQMIERTAHTLRTMGNMERFRGHFYNWYDTLSLNPLPPLYVSTVDSGNLAGHLLTLRQGLLEIPDRPINVPRLAEGFSDILLLLADAAGESAPTRLVQIIRKEPWLNSFNHTVPAEALHYFEDLSRCAAEISILFENDSESESSQWADALVNHCRAAIDELTFLTPWVSLGVPTATLNDLPGIDTIPTLRELSLLHENLRPVIEHRLADNAGSDESEWLGLLLAVLFESAIKAARRIAVIEKLVLQSGDSAAMEYNFLYDRGQHLLSIGYNADQRRCDSGYYDLLASEARLCSFVAIAQGQIPQDNWFALGRQLSVAGGQPILVSWSGSMFEYLMPLLIMPTYDETCSTRRNRAIVARQIEYGRQRGVPWGISESGYNSIDVSLNYQYRSFGVPGIGLKRGLADDLVITPYASMLALMVDPERHD